MREQALCSVVECGSSQRENQVPSPEVRPFGAFLRNNKDSKARVIRTGRLEIAQKSNQGSYHIVGNSKDFGYYSE